MSSEYGTYKTVRARFWPWLSGKWFHVGEGVETGQEAAPGQAEQNRQDTWSRGLQAPSRTASAGSSCIHPGSHLVLSRSLKLSPSESHIFKTVSHELCPCDGRSRHIAADGRRPCEGARRCQAISFPRAIQNEKTQETEDARPGA